MKDKGKLNEILRTRHTLLNYIFLYTQFLFNVLDIY